MGNNAIGNAAISVSHGEMCTMDSALAKSKYKNIKGFADRRTGHIILQDHNEEVYFRDLKIRILK